MHKRKIKVLAIIHGEDVFIRKLIESLEKEFIDIERFYLISRTNPIKILRDFLRLRKKINKFKPNIIHAHYGTMTSFFAAYTSFIPLVITFHGSDLNKTPLDGFFRDIIGRFLSQISALRAKSIICVSKKLKESLWWFKDKVEIIPTGIDVSLFKPMDKYECRKKLSLDFNKKYILFCSSKRKIKRLDIAMEVVNKLNNNNLYNLLELDGFIDNNLLPVYMNAADCLLVCSDNEGSPTIMKEAMACNLPIVSNDVGDIAERLKNVNNSIISVRTPEDLSRAVLEIINRNERSNGRDVLINDGLTENIVTDRIIKNYSNILSSKRIL